MLEAESGFNDAPVVILVVALADAAPTRRARRGLVVTLVLKAVVELAGGAAIGLAVGWVGGRLLRRVASGSSGLFSHRGRRASPSSPTPRRPACTPAGSSPATSRRWCWATWRLPHRPAVRGFATALGWLAQIGLFVLLGLLASPGRTGRPARAAPSSSGWCCCCVARPLSVLVSMTPFRMPWRDQAFLSWAGLRGAVPVVLATVPLTVGAPDVDWIFDLVFVLVVIFTLVQAPTLPWVAQRLGVAEAYRSRRPRRSSPRRWRSWAPS